MRANGTIRTVGEVFETMGGTTSLARALAIGVSTASEIKRRGRIPAEYWREIIRAAARSGHPEITAELLADLHAREVTSTGPAEEGKLVETGTDCARGGIAEAEGGQFSRFRHLRRNRFRTLEEINDHIDALREEWSRR